MKINLQDLISQINYDLPIRKCYDGTLTFRIQKYTIRITIIKKHFIIEKEYLDNNSRFRSIRLGCYELEENIDVINYIKLLAI